MMKIQRLGLVAAALICLLSINPARAAGSQEIRGYVVQPMWEEGCDGFAGAVLETAGRAYPGFRFTVDSSTWGLPFVLSSDLPLSDIDISFRQGPGVPWQQRFETRTFGGEDGIVPSGVTEAMVCLYLGAPTTFTYGAGPTV